MKNNIPIFLSSDNNYAPFIATTVASICENTQTFCEFYIIDDGISVENQEKICELKKQYDNFSIQFVKIDAQKYFKDFLTSSYITIAAYFRILIPKMFSQIKKFLYLDVDIILQDDISKLFNEDLEGYIIGAVKDCGDSYFIEKLKLNVDIDLSHNYFNSGVLLIDSEKWNEQNVMEKLFEIEKKYRGNLECNDQDILNKFFENNYKVLPQKYNSRTIENDTYVRHFYQKIKPWFISPNVANGEKLLSGHKKFWEYAKKTKFYEELLENCKYNSATQVQLLLFHQKSHEKWKPKVSIIIPVYNTGKYLKRCLDSVLNQTLKDIEIICINDCSSDNSLEILKEYASDDTKFKIINFVEHKGVSKARNAGLQIAQGEYIGFIDSDDYIDLDFYERLYDKAVSSNAQVVKAEMVNVFEDSDKKIPTNTNKKIEQNKLNFCNEFTTAIYKNEFLKENNICFPIELVTSEDPVFSAEVILSVENLALIYNTNYYYELKKGNAQSTASFPTEHRLSHIKATKMFMEFLNNKQSSKEDYIFFHKERSEDFLCRCIKAKVPRSESKELFEQMQNEVKAVLKFPISEIENMTFENMEKLIIEAKRKELMSAIRSGISR